MTEQKRTLVATVRKPHGVKGGLKVALHGIDLNTLKALDTLFVKTESGWESHQVTMVQGTDTDAILLLAGIDNRESAESLRSTEFYADDDELPQLEEFEFYVEDLIGCDVYDSEGAYFGKVSQVLLNQDQDILEVRLPDDTETLIPFVEEWIEAVDVNALRITVTPWETR
ncbi:MAG: ribosome maturation factor RimM [Candidatus Marinimicrobia bacterium]|nr:ribosome maturation factor RimM [Candidatus Neomarinimicrobiota bacterium]MCF7839230.1 ribosome maturation factor RimM [Candidatus Neomarinimicrobiota bacterium]